MGGSLEYKEISDFMSLKQYKKIKNFVETGTYKAETTLMAAEKFKHVYTTEIVPALHNESKAKASSKGVKNVSFLLGDSVELLKEIVPKVLDGAVFFLDAHQSGCDTSNNGKNHVPLFQELDVILSSYDGRTVGPSIFIIDDLRLFDKYWDWEGINTKTIVQKFRDCGHNIGCFFSQQDRFYVMTL